MPVTISAESPLQDEVRAMVADLNAFLRPLSPPQFQFQMTAEQMAGADTTVFVLRGEDGAAIGMGSVKVHTPEFGEVKRMFTRPDVRGTGLGRLILNAVEAEARRMGLQLLRLETGGTPGFEPAWRCYERGGYVRRSAFLDYPDSEYSRFYEKKLSV
jgi:putative acetyltransferase